MNNLSETEKKLLEQIEYSIAYMPDEQQFAVYKILRRLVHEVSNDCSLGQIVRSLVD